MSDAYSWMENNRLAEDNQLILSWHKLGAQTLLSREMVEDARFDVRETLTGDLLMQLQAYVLGEKLPENTVTATGSVSVEYPASWWQHFKHTYRAHWWIRALARRRPPRMQTKTETGTVTATWHHMTAYPWARYTHRVPASERLGYPVYLRWSEHDWKGGMFR